MTLPRATPSLRLPSWAPLTSMVAFALLSAAAAHADAPDSTYHHDEAAPRIRAAHTDASIKVDGVLDEAAWTTAEPATVFTQLDPEEGKPASERTEVRVLIDGDAIVIGARLYDREPGKIRAQLARRDDPNESDAFEVSIDSYHDHLTARRFRVNPAGAIRDAAIGTDGNEDDSWDAVWESAARVDSGGWSCEIRIPLAQLRYNTQNDATWGIQFVRTIFRKAEASYFSFCPKKEQGGVNRYGHLVGLGRLPEPRRLEVMPYVAARNERLEFAVGDPFRSADDVFGNAGGDVRYGLTTELTLDLTVNPDFGQVEVDPAEVNLTAFETFYPERRPFFVQGADLFTFGRSRALNNFGVPTIFHSRRIGRPPQRSIGGTNYNFPDIPLQTTIAGAAKLTGRTSRGWSIGVLDAITTDENARYLDTLGVERSAEIEPPTHYFAGRLRRDLRDGNTSIGGLVTMVNRDLSDPALAAQLRSDAYLGGIDLAHSWGHRRWAIDANATAATVRGSESAIAATQRSSPRYYQRPDHDDYVVYDPTRTDLSGYGMDASFAKTSGEHWLYSLAYVDRSPGYEANDLGFQTRADYRGLSSIVLYQENKPGRLFRYYSVFPYANEMWNYGNDRAFDSYALDFNGQFANYWPFDLRATLNRPAADDRLTRGGPQARTPESGNWIASLDSDTRKSWSVGFDYTRAWNEFGGTGDFPALSFSFRPSPTLRLRFEPAYSVTHALAQYVAVVPDPDAAATYGKRYVFATLDQSVASLVTRVDWTLTPRLSFQLYVQPLVVAGAFSDYKEFRAPETFEFDVYGKHKGSITRSPDGFYTIDPGNGALFGFPDPNFNFRSLLGNAVMRWEYRPGSTLYFVWQQRRTDVETFGDFEFGRDYRGLLEHRPENVFAVKATYWIGL